MAASPVGTLFIIAIYTGVMMMVVADPHIEGEAKTFGLDTTPKIEKPGGPDALLEVFEAVWDVVKWILGAITFNVDGAPVALRIMVTVAVVSSLIWSVATLVRGN